MGLFSIGLFLLGLRLLTWATIRERLSGLEEISWLRYVECTAASVWRTRCGGIVLLSVFIV